MPHSYSAEMGSVEQNYTVLNLTGTYFTGNVAENIGGGLYLENLKLTTTADVIMEGCQFENNTSEKLSRGQGGHVTNYQLLGSVSHYMPQFRVTISETNCIGNEKEAQTEDSLGCGTLYVAQNAQTVVRDSSFSYNNCSGIVAVQSSIVFHGSIEIANNTAYNGGGIVLCANSVMFLSSGVNITIKNNTARNHGGGIYAQFECSQATPPCFYGADKNHTSVYINHNAAQKAGNAVYGGSIDYCYTGANSLLIDNERLQFNDLFKVSYPKDDHSVISSDPYGVCFCQNNSAYPCIYTFQYNKTVYPGQTISVNAVVIGQRSGRAVGVILASLNNSDFDIEPLQKSQTVSSVTICKTLSYKIYLNNPDVTQENVSIFLAVEDEKFRDVSANTFHQPYIALKDVRICPPGFD